MEAKNRCSTEVDTSQLLKNDDTRKMSREATAGLLAGVITRFIFSPLDVVKIRMQNQIIPQRFTEKRYQSVFQSMSLIYSKEGIQGLWRGTVPGLLLWGGYSALQFPIYKQLKRIMHRLNGLEDSEKEEAEVRKKDLVESFFCGGISAVVAQMVAFPLDNVRTRMISAHLEDPTYNLAIKRQFKTIIRSEGVRGLFAGLSPTILQVAPNSALTFMIYEAIVIPSSLTDRFRTESETIPLILQSVAYLFRGGVAGFLAKVVTYPLDTIKKRLQVNGTLKSIPQYNSGYHCFHEMLRNEGVWAFYNGLSPQLYKTVFSSATTFWIFELCNDVLQERT